MGTKRDPGEFDCYEKAEVDEPMFTLLARDPLAPELVDLWAAIRSGMDGVVLRSAVRLLAAHHRTRLAMTQAEQNKETTKQAEAFSISDDMRAWRGSHRQPVDMTSAVGQVLGVSGVVINEARDG